MSPYKQTLYVVWGNQLFFILGLALLWSWWTIPLAIFGLFVFGCFSEISVHRYYTHKSYKTSTFKEKILRVFALLAGQGAIISWVTVHRTHHAYEDTARDPHSPFFHPWWKILLGLYPQEYKKTLVVDLMRSAGWKYYLFENQYYWLLWTAIWLVTFLIHPILFYFIVSGSAMWYIATSAVNILSHSKIVGIQYYTETVATNSRLLNLFTAIGHHNNHHKFPNSYTYSLNGEIDIYGFVIKKFFAKK